MLKEKVRQDMFAALKAGNTSDKVALSLLVSSLESREKEKKSPLTPEEEITAVSYIVKQTRETLETAPEGRYDIKVKAQHELDLFMKYLPEQMSEEKIKVAINTVIFDFVITPVKANKGKIMKELMPKVKGKADGKLVNQILDSMLS